MTVEVISVINGNDANYVNGLFPSPPQPLPPSIIIINYCPLAPGAPPQQGVVLAGPLLPRLSSRERRAFSTHPHMTRS